ncbi:MAG: serine/threonine protein kinase, partial [Mycobacterium sp.]
VAMKHIKETPAPLPADLPPNVRELIEITLVKNPGMRYRSGGPFADAVAAVRAGRRPPRPNQAPTIGRAAPANIPSAAGPQSRPVEVRGPATNMRPRPTTGSHRPPPPRRTFSSGQRALLWAAGVLGALAIVIAVLIVVNARKDAEVTPNPPTVTDTVTPSGTEPPPAAPSNWTEHQVTGNPGLQTGQALFQIRLPQHAAPPVYDEISR